MKLLLIRHATAVPRGTSGIADDERPLTPEGQTKFLAAARGLARIARRPDVLLTSPLPRARVTAEIAAGAFGNLDVTIEPALAHGGVDAIVAVLRNRAADATVALVGHEPALGALLGRLLGTKRDDGLTFDKGGAALVDLPEGPTGPGRLIWFVEPRVLRALSRGIPATRRGVTVDDGRNESRWTPRSDEASSGRAATSS